MSGAPKRPWGLVFLSAALTGAGFLTIGLIATTSLQNRRETAHDAVPDSMKGEPA